MQNWLQDNYVLLTGASGGIGKALTKILIQKYGAKVIGVGRSEEKMLALKKELGEDSDDFSYRLFDVADKSAWTALVDDLTAKNIRPVLLVNNAGAFPPLQRAANMPSEAIEKTLQTNFLSMVYAIEAISPLLIGSGKQKPAVVNVSSSAALCPVVARLPIRRANRQ